MPHAGSCVPEATVRAGTRTRLGPFTLLTKRHPQKFANSDITQSLLTYLGRYREFTSPDEMKRVVSLLHRQAVRAKAEGLFFQVKSFVFDPCSSAQRFVSARYPH